VAIIFFLLDFEEGGFHVGVVGGNGNSFSEIA
jgi:hypothetical protein